MSYELIVLQIWITVSVDKLILVYLKVALGLLI